MTYIILAAGKGNNLKPLTLKYPKTSYKLNSNETVLQHLVRSIRKYDDTAEVIVVLGYLADAVKNELEYDNVKFIVNPFYEVTNSISSLWFAKQYLERENVTIIHGDVVFDEHIMKDILTINTKNPFVLVDSSIKLDGAYNVVFDETKVVLMSKKLDNFDAKYACVSKLDAVSARLLKQEINDMVNSNM